MPAYVFCRPPCRDSIGEPLAEMSAVLGAGTRSTGFGPTTFDMAADVAPPRRPGPDSAFDVCHVGVVLRALFYVHGVMAIGMVFAAPSFAISPQA
jgi:two-component system, LytTR family, sensor histidine kinase AlgZ